MYKLFEKILAGEESKKIDLRDKGIQYEKITIDDINDDSSYLLKNNDSRFFPYTLIDVKKRAERLEKEEKVW